MTCKSLEKAFSHALRLLTRKDYSVYELTVKLKPYCASDEDVSAVIARLQELRYQSDERCADMLVRHYVGNGYGRQRIYYEAKIKGIARDLVTSCLDNTDIDWNILARDAVLRKYEHPESLEYRDKQKVMAFLVRRGFSPNEALTGLRLAVTESMSQK